ncbi:uncharacterized protein LOC105158794 [Sesamum indicum]|uniref:Uncharacterized protein LOC105158794 n=1 Tax=Sesamum indicum TaxID=4182 RepID=A0A6I9SUU6_SESIN|nr:uncharacterized protein LOC105158794 [Sesamum indicum]
MMRARRYINYNEECIIDIPPAAEGRPDHDHRSTSSAGDYYQSITHASLQISAQAAIAMCGYALSGSSSHQTAINLAAAGFAVGFLCSWMAIAVRGKKPGLADLMAKISFTATAAAVVVPMGLLFIPGKYRWLSVLLPIIPVVATFQHR